MKAGIIYDDVYLLHDTGFGHPESPKRLRDALESLRESGLLFSGSVEIVKPRKASIDEIKLVHSSDYIDLVRRIAERGGGALDSDTVVSKDSWNAALFAAGGLLEACRLIVEGKLSNAFALVRPPGHHVGFNGAALTAPSAGFCIFNNVAISASKLLREGFSKIAIVDVDCHHGNGTQEIFYNTSKVLFISTHQDPRTLYPGTGYIDEVGEGDGEGYNINIPLPPGTGDDVYMMVFDTVVVPILKQYEPEFILVSTGFDAHSGDPITNMNLSAHGYRYAFNKILNVASETCSGRVAAVLEGGYGYGLKISIVAVIAEMAGLMYEVGEGLTNSSKRALEHIDKLMKDIRQIIGRYWRI
ncbi:MAG: histone deacetylase [Candidatus Methanomethylicia archaeon]